MRFVRNHAKIATVESSRLRVLLRGSMNLNHNPRFEQLDVTEGGPDFDLVRRLELELPVLRITASDPEIFAASKVAQAFDQATLAPFVGLKTFRK